MDVAEQPAPVPPASVQSPARDRGLIELSMVRLPRRIEGWAPRLADGLSDGAWTVIWPAVAAYLPAAFLLVGFALGALHPLLPTEYPQYPRVWSEYLPFMMLVVAGSILSGTAGVAVLAGYIAGDLVRIVVGAFTGGLTMNFEEPPIAVALYVAATVVVYLLLAIPAVTLPQLARSMAERAPVRSIADLGRRKLVRAVIAVAAVGVLTFFWTRAVVVLMRPAFTWRGEWSPTTDAIEPVQFMWEWLVGAAVVAMIARLVLQELVARRHPGAARIASVQAARWAGADPGGWWRRIGPVARVAVMAVTATVLLGGTYEEVIDAGLVFAIAALVGAWRLGLILPTSPWAAAVERIPAIARLAIAGVLGYGLARIATETLYATGSIRIVLVGVLLIVAVFAVLFPPASAQRERPAEAAP